MADPPGIVDRLNSALTGRYVVERELGEGGMAVVHLAEDLKHHRSVAIKVLKPELAHAVGAERFLREIATTANLRHPHILPLFDSGTVDDLLYYVMPYVEGETLRQRLERETRLPVAEALEIAREVADALSHAHARGVIHRDIKPENILLESGHAVVADFGIAKMVTSADDARLTHTGFAVGSIAYMSPEQSVAEAEIDGRSDLYSLGAVLYECLTGEQPFTGSAAAILAQRLTKPVPPVRARRPEIPSATDLAIRTAMAIEVSARFPDCREFAAALMPSSPPPAPGDRDGEAVSHSVDAPAASSPHLPEELRILAKEAEALQKSRDAPSLRRALQLWGQVSESHPEHAPAHAASATILTLLTDLGAVDTADALPRAIEMARHAITLDPSLADAHAALAFASTIAWHWDSVSAEFDRALKLERSPTTLQAFALFRAAAGDAAGALRSGLEARELDPSLPQIRSLIAALRYYAGEPERAADEARETIERSSDSPFTHLILALAEEARGDTAAATRALKAGMMRYGSNGVLLAALGHVQATTGDRTGAARTIKVLWSEGGPAAPAFTKAAVQAALGESNAAFDSLHRAVAEHDGWLLSLRLHPWMDPLRDDPRFAALLRVVGPPSDEPERPVESEGTGSEASPAGELAHFPRGADHA